MNKEAETLRHFLVYVNASATNRRLASAFLAARQTGSRPTAATKACQATIVGSRPADIIYTSHKHVPVTPHTAILVRDHFEFVYVPIITNHIASSHGQTHVILPQRDTQNSSLD